MVSGEALPTIQASRHAHLGRVDRGGDPALDVWFIAAGRIGASQHGACVPG